MKLIKEFNLFGKKEEIIEKFKINIQYITELGYFNEIYKKMLDKNVSFISENTHKKVKMKLKHISLLYQPDIPISHIAVFFGDKNENYLNTQTQVDTDHEIEIWGKRIITKEDPYGEENWTE